jgi:restriction system protein
MTAPATTRRTRTRTRTAKRNARRRTLHIPRLGWWWIAIGVALYTTAKTWPLQTAITVALIAIGCTLAARRPDWLQHATRRLPAIHIHRSRLPARGHRTLAAFQHMRHDHFEHAIAELARQDQDRVHSATRVGGANDRGADVLVQLRDGRRILIQCKKHQPGNNVGSDTLQKTNGVYRDIHRCHAAIIVTTAGYTRDAVQTNTLLPYPIRLIDGPQLTAWANGAPPPWA